LSLAAWVVGIKADAPKTIEPPKKFDLAAIDAYLAAEVKEKGYPGLSCAIVRDGKTVFAHAYGKVSLDDKAEAATPETPFWIGSVTKQFACACVLLLAEEGKLSVNDPVAKYYPKLTRAKDITLHDLMSHVSGYPDYYPLDFVDRRMLKPEAVDKIIGEYAGGKLDFEPRARYSYSNTGYMILGRVVEKVSGETLGKFMTERILKPLGMKHSAFEPAVDAKGLAKGYRSFALGDPEPAPPEAEGWLYAAGGLTASAPDLARWDLGLMEGKVLNPEMLRLMTTPRKLTTGKTSNYGCGLQIVDRNGEAMWMHNGAVSGFLAFNAMIPRTKSAVVLLTNSEHLDPGSLFRTLVALVLKDQADKEAVDVPKVTGPTPKDAALEFLHEMQAGEVNRKNLGEEFSFYLTDEKLKAAAPRLKALGEPEKVEVEGVAERGGMEVARIKFTFKTVVLHTSLYRTPDGVIQQLLFTKD
jgi:CubicO group peptidase (beta-lactamase class C family)